MSRNRTTAQLAADVAPHRGIAVLLELLFDSGTLRLCAGPWDVTAGGNLYLRTGAALHSESHQEAADGTEGLALTLTGLPAGVFGLVVAEPYQRRLVRVLEQRFNTDDTPADAATVEYVGRMVALSSTEEVASRRWTVSIQTEIFDAEGRRAPNIRYSDAEQRRRYSADLGAEYVASMVERVMSRAPT